MSTKDPYKIEIEALSTVLAAVANLEPKSQLFVFRTAIDRLELELPSFKGKPSQNGSCWRKAN